MTEGPASRSRARRADIVAEEKVIRAAAQNDADEPVRNPQPDRVFHAPAIRSATSRKRGRREEAQLMTPSMPPFRRPAHHADGILDIDNGRSAHHRPR
jgi:hypothetical protein